MPDPYLPRVLWFRRYFGPNRTLRRTCWVHSARIHRQVVRLVYLRDTEAKLSKGIIAAGLNSSSDGPTFAAAVVADTAPTRSDKVVAIN
jgi:hypothetical protein